MPNWIFDLRLPSFGWRDLVDLAIISLVIYEILKAIRGTRAVQMAIGSAMFVLVFYLSQWGDLETVNWLVRNVASYIVFAMIVLFQADIRRALAHLGRGPVFRYFLGAESADEVIEELVGATRQLGMERVGAIIIIERQIGLRNYIGGGSHLMPS
jgi:diadenylate cyclase